MSPETGLAIYKCLFYLLITCAYMCATLSFYFFLKTRDYQIGMTSLLLFASGSTSLTASNLPYDIARFLIMTFYVFDFFIYYYFLQKKGLRLIWNISAFLLLFFFMGSIAIKIWNSKLNSAYLLAFIVFLCSFFLSILSISNFTLLKNRNQYKEKEDAFLFWIMGSCLFLNLSTLPGNFLELATWNIWHDGLVIVTNSITFFCWIIKYFLLLKAVLCKRVLI